MPALKSSPLETAVPSQTRRRLWTNPELASHSVLVLTLDTIYLTPQTGVPKPSTVAAIEQGVDLVTLFGPLSTVIDLASVSRLRLDLTSNSLVLEYSSSGIASSRQTITFSTPEAADSCFTKIWRRLGDGFELQPYKRDSWSLAQSPLLLLAGVLSATVVICLLLSIAEDFAGSARAARMTSPLLGGGLGNRLELPHTTMETVLEWTNWRAICGAGGVGAALSQVWLYRRLTSPPRCLEIRRS